MREPAPGQAEICQLVVYYYLLLLSNALCLAADMNMVAFYMSMLLDIC